MRLDYIYIPVCVLEQLYSYYYQREMIKKQTEN